MPAKFAAKTFKKPATISDAATTKPPPEQQQPPVEDLSTNDDFALVQNQTKNRSSNDDQQQQQQQRSGLFGDQYDKFATETQEDQRIKDLFGDQNVNAHVGNDDDDDENQNPFHQPNQQQPAASSVAVAPEAEKSLTQLFLEHKLRLEREKMFGASGEQGSASEYENVASAALEVGQKLQQQQQNVHESLLSAAAVGGHSAAATGNTMAHQHQHHHHHHQHQQYQGGPSQRFLGSDAASSTAAGGGGAGAPQFEDEEDDGPLPQEIITATRRQVDGGQQWQPARRCAILPPSACAFWRDVQGIDINPVPRDGPANPCLDVEDLELPRSGLKNTEVEHALCSELGGSRMMPLLQHALPEALRGTSIVCTGPSGCGKSLLAFVVIAQAVATAVARERAATSAGADSTSGGGGQRRGGDGRGHKTIALMLVPTREAQDDEAYTLRRIAKYSSSSSSSHNQSRSSMLSWFSVSQGLPADADSDRSAAADNSAVHVFNATSLLYSGHKLKSDQQRRGGGGGEASSSEQQQFSDDHNFDQKMRRAFKLVSCIVCVHAERFAIPPFTHNHGGVLFRVPGHLYPIHRHQQEQALQTVLLQQKQQQQQQQMTAKEEGQQQEDGGEKKEEEINQQDFQLTSDAQWILIGNEPARLWNFARSCESALSRRFVGYRLENRAVWSRVVHATEFVTSATERPLLYQVLQRTPPPVIIFTASRRMCDELVNDLKRIGVRATGDPISMSPGSKQQQQQQPTLRFDVLCVADAAIKGFHRELLPFAHVINFELPPAAAGQVFDDVMLLRAECLGLSAVAGSQHRSGTGLVTTFVSNERVNLGLAVEFVRFLKKAKLPVPLLMAPLRKRKRVFYGGGAPQGGDGGGAGPAVLPTPAAHHHHQQQQQLPVSGQQPLSGEETQWDRL